MIEPTSKSDADLLISMLGRLTNPCEALEFELADSYSLQFQSKHNIALPSDSVF